LLIGPIGLSFNPEPVGLRAAVLSLNPSLAVSKQSALFRRSLPIILLILLAFALRLYRLDSQSLRGDEAASVLYSALPLADLWELARITDPHPPLYYALLHPWQSLLGEGVWVMRFAGTIASTLAIPAVYALARRTLGHTLTAWLAAALLAINPLQLWLAQDIRSYPFFTTLGLLSSAILWAALHPPTHTPPKRLWFLYILVTVACFYIHYYTVFLLAFQGLFVLVNWQKFWPYKWPWLASQAIMGLLLIPGLQLAYRFADGEAAGGIETLPTFDLFRLAGAALLTGFTLDQSWGGWVSLMLLPVAIIGIIFLLWRNRVSGTFWFLFFAGPLMGVILLSIGRPFFKERFLVQAQPALAVLLAVSFIALGSQKLPITNTARVQCYQLLPLRFMPYFLRFISGLFLVFLIFINTLSLTNYFTNPAYAKAPQWRLYHDYVSQQARPNDVMLTNFPEAAVSYYSPNSLPFYVVPAERDQSSQYRLSQTADIAAAYQRIWFLPLLRQGFDEQGQVLNWLDRHADRVNQVFFPDYHINLYLSPPALEASLIPQPVAFAHGPQLRGYQILDKKGESRLVSLPDARDYLLTVQPEDKFSLSLYWLAAGPTAQPYTVFVHLIAADGFNRTSHDNQPVWGSYLTTQWQAGEKITDKYDLTIPAGTPAGDHRLHVGWYNPTTQERAPVVDQNGQPSADHTILNLIIRVEPSGNGG
jgi:4-amino-4-deoxy-L-arabinose transferase-like glycosyltransferase